MPVTIQPGEKLSTVMIFTNEMLVVGDVVTKEAIRVSTWLRTAALPQFIWLHEAKILQIGGGAPRQLFLSEMHLPSAQVKAFHLKPPAQDPLDYEPNEPNRKMMPVTSLVGLFRFDGLLRMSTQTELDRFLEVAKENYVSMYDITITNPSIPNLSAMHVPYSLLRMAYVQFAPRSVS
jgi:hypothetical protein